jgi:protein phosphatase
MPFTICAACHCHTGLVRQNNEDNFYFDGWSLQERNAGLSKPLTLSAPLTQRQILAVFDGMGGEANGENAAFTAAKALFRAANTLTCPGDGDFSLEAAQAMNLAVWESAKALGTERMGSTLAMLTFREDHVYACNLGDSRIFRLREGALHQLSLDHTDEAFLREQGIRRRPRLTQHLGINPEEFEIAPHVAGFFLRSGDWYVICSDGVTDLIDPGRLVDIIYTTGDPALCAQSIVDTALSLGGRDNITVIVCRADEEI